MCPGPFPALDTIEKIDCRESYTVVTFWEIITKQNGKELRDG
jgi:hypothetical protein